MVRHAGGRRRSKRYGDKEQRFRSSCCRRPRSSTAAASSVAPIARAPASAPNRNITKVESAPPATSPSCGQRPLHHSGGPSRSRCAAPESSATPRQGRSLRSPELQRRPRTGISLKWNRRRPSGIQEEGTTPPPRAWPAAYPGPAWRQGRSLTLSRRVHPFTVCGERPLPNGEIFEFQPALERLCGPDRARRPNR
jgi:hypothetical protein